MRATALVLVAAALAGCGDRSAVEDGGRVPGEILTVYVLVPREAPAAGQVIRGAKVALAQAGGRIGRFTVQFATADLPAGEDAAADAVEDVVRDVGTIAVIADLGPASARTTAPLLNAVGLLHVSPGPAAQVAQPAALRTYFPLDLLRERHPPPPGFERTFAGLEAGPFAGAGYTAMQRVLAALRAAGDRAPLRRAVVEAFAAR